MTNTAIAAAVDYAIKNGCAPIQFDKTCSAGGYTRRFSGCGTLRISTDNNSLYIGGAGGFITMVHVYSRNEAIEYIQTRFHHLCIDMCRANAEVRALA